MSQTYSQNRNREHHCHVREHRTVAPIRPMRTNEWVRPDPRTPVMKFLAELLLLLGGLGLGALGTYLVYNFGKWLS